MIGKNSTICANYQLIMRMTGGFLKILDENMLSFLFYSLLIKHIRDTHPLCKNILFLDTYP